MKKRIIFLFLTLSLLANAQQKPTQAWLDQKFSMFIHFGLYSVYGGVYDGKPVEKGYSEQIQSFAGIFSDWYGNTARNFNPTQWNPDSVVALAKNAGMKSIVFTSKHHDGFCMYHSKYTDFNIVDATPYGKDLMKELAEACARGGLGFGVYYSLIDWHYPQAYPISSHNADPLTPEHFDFNMKQVEEIMTNYGPITEIWFDMGSLTPAQSKGLYDVVNRLQPQCMISGRLGNDYVDFAVMADNEYPDYKLAVPWQTAASIFDETWGYRSWQERGEVKKKADEKLASLVKVISRGGNYLLNIGPRGDGSVVEFEKEVLLAMGKWVANNSEAIYGATANPFAHSFEWGDVTENNGNLYLFVRSDYGGKRIELDGIAGEIDKVTELKTGKTSTTHTTKNKGDAYQIDVPQSSNEPFIVLKVSYKNGFTLKPSQIHRYGMLTRDNATSVFGHSSLNYYGGYKSLIAYEWAIDSKHKTISPILYYTENEKGKEIEIASGNKKTVLKLIPTGSKVVSVPDRSIKWGALYRKPGRGVFGNMEEEGTTQVDPDTSNWRKLDESASESLFQENISPRASIVLMQEVYASKVQEVAVELTSGNAVYVILNGEYITAHFSPDRIGQQTETVILPLKKGNNQLIVKFYNGFAKEITFGIKPLKEWTVYSQRLQNLPLGNTLSVRSANPESAVSPMRLNNLRLELPK